MWFFWWAGCDDTEFPPVGGETITGDTFADVLQVFEGNCVSCHNDSLTQGELDLVTDPCAALVDSPSFAYDGDLVVPQDHQGSVLWSKMADQGDFGGVMPPTGVIAQPSVDTVAAWIDAGASCGDTGAR